MLSYLSTFVENEMSTFICYLPNSQLLQIGKILFAFGNKKGSGNACSHYPYDVPSAVSSLFATSRMVCNIQTAHRSRGNKVAV